MSEVLRSCSEFSSLLCCAVGNGASCLQSKTQSGAARLRRPSHRPSQVRPGSVSSMRRSLSTNSNFPTAEHNSICNKAVIYVLTLG